MKQQEDLLLIIKDNRFRQMIKLVTDLSSSYNLIEAKTPTEGLKVIQSRGKQIKAIIYEYEGEDFSFGDIIQILNNKFDHINVLLVSQLYDNAIKLIKDCKSLTVVPRDVLLKEFNDIFQAVIGLSKADQSSDYRSVDIRSILAIDGIDDDVFIKASETKYIKLFKQGDVITQSDIDKYISQEVKTVYIMAQKAQDVIKQISKQTDFFLKHKAFKFVVRSKSDPKHKQFEQKIMRVHEELLIDEEFQLKLETVISNTMEQVYKINVLSQALDSIKDKKDGTSYLPEHMFLLSYVICIWAHRLGWHSRGTLDKLIYASILHDITLGGRPYLAEIEDIDHFKQVQDDLDDIDKKLYLAHPDECAQLASKYFTASPPDTSAIIRQHHELPSGGGFPRKDNWGKMSPLSILFIISHDYVDYILKHEGSKDKKGLESFFENISEKYPHQAFTNIINKIKY